jgi:hypothetical protein
VLIVVLLIFYLIIIIIVPLDVAPTGHKEDGNAHNGQKAEENLLRSEVSYVHLLFHKSNAKVHPLVETDIANDTNFLQTECNVIAQGCKFIAFGRNKHCKLYKTRNEILLKN